METGGRALEGHFGFYRPKTHFELRSILTPIGQYPNPLLGLEYQTQARPYELPLFQMIEGLRYAFPTTMARLEPQHPRLVTLHDRVMARPRIAAYLSSPRRLAFNEQGIFRHYPELEEG
jgi:hypothetical protein